MNNHTITLLQNVYVEVGELFQTACSVQKSPSYVTRIIFVFKQKGIIDGHYPCEGMKLAFLVRYKYTCGRFEIVTDTKCLPFPRLYSH